MARATTLREATGRSPETAEARFAELREMLRTAENVRIACCIRLADAYKRADWIPLHLGSFTAYARELGIAKSTASKMLKVGQKFADEIKAATPAERAELTVDAAYIAAQLVDRGVQSKEEAFSNALANPVEQMIAMRDGTEPADGKPVQCPECGQTHFCVPRDDGDGGRF